MDNGSSGEGATGPVKSLLSRWREKVFVLLVQQKLQQIQDNRERLEARAKVNPTYRWFHGPFYHGNWRALHHHAAC